MKQVPNDSDIFVWPDGTWQLRAEGLVHESRADFRTLWAGSQEWVDFAKSKGNDIGRRLG